MAFCTGCGSQLAEGMRFCQKCGRPIPAEASIASEIPVAPETPSTFATPAATEASSAYTPPAAPAPQLVTPPPPTYAPAPAPPPVAGPRYAGFWLRVVANLIDSAIMGIPLAFIFGICFFAFGGLALLSSLQPDPNFNPNNPDPAAVFARLAPLFGVYAVVILAAIILGWLYYAGMESSTRQATLGKSVLSLRVTDSKGSRLTFGHASGRYFAKIITSMVPLGVGWMLAGFTAKKQALHDMIAGTLVYRND